MDQAIGGRPAKQEVLDKRRSLQNPSGNLLDIHRCERFEYSFQSSMDSVVIHS